MSITQQLSYIAITDSISWKTFFLETEDLEKREIFQREMNVE